MKSQSFVISRTVVIFIIGFVRTRVNVCPKTIQMILKTLIPLSILRLESPLSFTSNNFWILFFNENEKNSNPIFVFLFSTLSVGKTPTFSKSGIYSIIVPIIPRNVTKDVNHITITVPIFNELSVSEYGNETVRVIPFIFISSSFWFAYWVRPLY